MENKFFGSKLNSVLLLFLIILMIVALVVMSNNKEIYLSGFKQINQKTEIEKNQNNSQINNEILGNKDDLVSFSFNPGQKVSGSMNVTGVIKGGYFFEANVLINILDVNKNVLKNGYGTATTDWMTSGPVTFTTLIDFTGLNSGPGYIEIQNDDPSDGEGGPAKKILIPVIIE
jgi:hypothetical protein